MPRPVVLQIGPYLPRDQEALDEAYEMLRLWEAEDKAAFLAEHGPRVRAIASRGNLRVPAEIIEACPGLEIISVFGVGYDGVDMEAARARGVIVTNTPDVLTGDVADLGVGLLIALWRGIPGADAWVRSGEWVRSGPYPLQRRVWGARAGVLGLGRIGRAVARRLEALDMAVSYTDLARAEDVPASWRYVADPVSLAAGVDVIFVTLAAAPQTRGLVGREVLAALGPEGTLVNISRGSVVDEDALLDALETRAIASAALDVYASEPDINPRFLKLDNVLLQPHHASGTHETRRAMGDLMRANLAAHFAGEPVPTPVPGSPAR